MFSAGSLKEISIKFIIIGNFVKQTFAGLRWFYKHSSLNEFQKP